MKRHAVVTVKDQCVFCGRLVQQPMPMDAYADWKTGTLIQKAWPESTEDERCRALGTHPECWPPEEPDEDHTQASEGDT